VPQYKLYRLKLSGEVELPPEEFFATSEDAALRHAARQDCPQGCELWSGERFIAVVTHAPEREGPEPRPSRWRRLARIAHLEGRL